MCLWCSFHWCGTWYYQLVAGEGGLGLCASAAPFLCGGRVLITCRRMVRGINDAATQSVLLLHQAEHLLRFLLVAAGRCSCRSYAGSAVFTTWLMAAVYSCACGTVSCRCMSCMVLLDADQFICSCPAQRSMCTRRTVRYQLRTCCVGWHQLAGRCFYRCSMLLMLLMQHDVNAQNCCAAKS